MFIVNVFQVIKKTCRNCVIFLPLHCFLSHTVVYSPMMSPAHKRSLSECRKTLVENMEPDDVLNYLQSREKPALTERQMKSIKAEATREMQVERFLSYLSRRPDRAFSDLVEALDATSQQHLSRLLTQSSGKNLFKLRIM